MSIADDDARVRAALQSLWGVTLVGHEPGGPCPYQVGHSIVEHVVIGLRLFDNVAAFESVACPTTEHDAATDAR